LTAEQRRLDLRRTVLLFVDVDDGSGDDGHDDDGGGFVVQKTGRPDSKFIILVVQKNALKMLTLANNNRPCAPNL
jgi:hypothetical protein